MKIFFIFGFILVRQQRSMIEALEAQHGINWHIGTINDRLHGCLNYESIKHKIRIAMTIKK